MIKDMTTGNPLKLIVSFSVPIILGNLVQQLYSWTDTVMVGKIIGNTALAAIGATGAITFLIIGFLIGISEGVCLLVSRYFGSGDISALKRCVGNIIYVCFTITLLLTFFALTFNRSILVIMKTPTDILDQSEAYLSVIYLGMFSTMLYNVSAGIMRALGDSKTPLYFLIASAVLNVVLNFLLISIIPLGVIGAALATVISQFCAGAVAFVFLIKRYDILKLSSDDLKPRKAYISKLCIMSLPMAFQYSITAIGSLFLQASINALGSAPVTAFTVGDKVWNFGWSIINCLGVGLASYCSQNIGAAKIGRVRKGVFHTGLIIACSALLVSIIYIVFGQGLSEFFLDEKTDEILEYISVYYKIHTPFLIVLSMIAVFRNAIMGLGYSIHGMTAGIFELVGRSSVSILFVKRFGFVACCFASPIAWLLADALLIPMYFYIIKKLSKEYSDRT